MGAWAASLTLGSVLLAGCIVTQHSDVPRCTALLGRAQGASEGGVRVEGGGGGVSIFIR